MELVLIRGLPGSGKSTLARSMTGHLHLEADMYFARDGEYRFERSELAAAHAWCQATARAALESGRRVVVSNTFTRRCELQPYFDMAAQLGIVPRIIEARGQWPNVHGVPEEDIERMRLRWEEDVQASAVADDASA